MTASDVIVEDITTVQNTWTDAWFVSVCGTSRPRKCELSSKHSDMNEYVSRISIPGASTSEQLVRCRRYRILMWKF